MQWPILFLEFTSPQLKMSWMTSYKFIDHIQELESKEREETENINLINTRSSIQAGTP